MIITPRLISVNYTQGRQGPYPLDTIVVHVTMGSAASVRSWFNNPKAEASTHYQVLKNGAIDQFVRECDSAWGNGRISNPTSKLIKARPNMRNVNPNDWTISIEHEGDGSEDLKGAQLEASVWLIKDIATRNRIPLNRDHVLRHQEIYAVKTCPGRIQVDRLVRLANA